MTKRYYLVAVRPGRGLAGQPWEIHGGFYSRDDAQEEADDWAYSNDMPRQRTKVLECNDTQASCNEAIANLNNR